MYLRYQSINIIIFYRLLIDRISTIQQLIWSYQRQLPVDLFFTYVVNSVIICDVVCMNQPYEGTNSVLLDQLFSHVCDNIHSWNCIGMLISDKYRRPWYDAANNARRLKRAYDICPSIRQVFADDDTFCSRSCVSFCMTLLSAVLTLVIQLLIYSL